jgi:endonuclease/exonuclease/phosphatase family metal-dependent hydrolase
MAELRVMTFNVRQMDGDDGKHEWEHRKDVLIETIRMRQPTLLGTQETWDAQTAYILTHLPEYRAFGRGRYGDARDKHNKVFYDPERVQLLDTGEIWISKTPDVPGSSDWEIPSPRMITWGLLRLDNTVDVMALNTHFPYGRGAAADEARRQTARLILEKIAELPPGLPIILTGDFNAKPDGEVYQMLQPALKDAWTTAGHSSGPAGTVHGFGRFEGGRVDWILYRHVEQVLAVETLTHTAEGLYPSDHYPVCATFDLGLASGTEVPGIEAEVAAISH